MEGKSVNDPRRDSLPSSMMSDIVWTSYIIVYISCGCCRYVIYTGRQYTVHTRRDKAKSRTPSHSQGYSSSGSAGAQSTQRPLPFPLATRSTTLGCEHVTACVAEILFSIKMSDMQEIRTRKVNRLTFVCLLTSPIDCPCTQRYRGNGPCHLSATDTTLRKSRIYSRGIANVR